MLGSSSFVRRLGIGALAAGAALLSREPDARACGGCFHGPPPPQQTVDSVISAHRMVLSISTTQTVLWDQVQYSGQPGDFAWVLPVKPGALIQLSHDEWIASLEAATQTVIQGPSVTCGGPPQEQDVGGGSGCGSSAAASGFAPGAANGSASQDAGVVQVVSQQVVGPYDAVTVRSSQGEALGDWLRANGYQVPTSLQPLIDTFTSEGFDFIALKLAPGEGVQAMQPVRVVMPGASLSLPLRMVAAGVGANVGLELFVLGEGEYQTQNFPMATIDFSKLAWDPSSDISNYTTLAAAALATNGGTSWITEMAGPVQLGFYTDPSVYDVSNPALDSAYNGTCVPQTFIPPSCSGDAGLGSSTDSGTDAGDSGSCQPVVIPCDDLTVAMNGIDPAAFTVTRLRASLPSTALGVDLVMEASPAQAPVTSFHATQLYTVPGYNPCAGTSNGSTQSRSSNQAAAACATTPKPGTRYEGAIVLLATAVGIAFGARARGRRSRRA